MGDKDMLESSVKLPPSFDYEFYKKDKPGLNSREEAYKHFVTIGRHKGLKGSPACDQGYLLRYLRNMRPEKVLEIGPGCSPKLKGDNVFYFDVKSREELKKRYKSGPDAKNIPEKIHYIDGTGYLGNIDDEFDIIFSSHVIEHALDIIEHLNEVEALLCKNGIYIVVVPNKNFTFDYFKPVSLVEDVLSQHFGSAHTSSLTLRAILLESHRRTHNSPERHWANDHGEVCFDKARILESIRRFEDIAANCVAMSGYHKWIFTEESFVEIVNALNELELIPLRVLESYNTPFGGMSFSAILGR